MRTLHPSIALAFLLVGGCVGEKVEKVASLPPVASKPLAMPKTERLPTAPVVALLEPYLVVSTAPAPMPPSLRGRILPNLPTAPITPLPPLSGIPSPPVTAPETSPKTPPPKPNPAPVAPTPFSPRGPLVPNALVRLFQEERARSVADARDRVSAASTRATATAAEAKRLWGYVKDGFVAQKQAENADAAAKAAISELGEAQKTLDAAQQRQRDARKDIENALRAAQTPSGLELVQRTVPSETYQAVPNTYRLSVLGSSPVKITVQNGSVLKTQDLKPGEAGAWLVRCIDPTALRLGVDRKAAKLWIRTLPEAELRTKA